MKKRRRFSIHRRVAQLHFCDLALQKLCGILGGKGKDINSDIKELVNKGLSTHIQQALDIVRVIGNNAVHPGQIDIQDNPEIAKELFNLMNEIVEDQLSKIHKLAQIDKIYKSLPPSTLKGIDDRDKPKQKP